VADDPQELQTPTLAEVIQGAIEDRLEDLHTCQWGYITSYDAASQSCSVQLIARRSYTVEGGATQTERPAPLVSVPVMFPGAGDYSITWPLKTGDVVLVVFAERSMHQWNAGGHQDIELDDQRMHSLCDGIAIPGLRPRTAPIDNPPDNAMVLTAPDGLRLGSKNASAAVVVQTALDFFGLAIKAAIAACTTPTPDPPAIHALTALQTALGIDPITGTGWDAGTEKTKAE